MHNIVHYVCQRKGAEETTASNAAGGGRDVGDFPAPSNASCGEGGV
jgi:hypothetical protein